MCGVEEHQSTNDLSSSPGGQLIFSCILSCYTSSRPEILIYATIVSPLIHCSCVWMPEKHFDSGVTTTSQAQAVSLNVYISFMPSLLLCDSLEKPGVLEVMHLGLCLHLTGLTTFLTNYPVDMNLKSLDWSVCSGLGWSIDVLLLCFVILHLMSIFYIAKSLDIFGRQCCVGFDQQILLSEGEASFSDPLSSSSTLSLLLEDAGIKGLNSKRHMKVVLRWMKERQRLKLICNHVGPNKQFLYTTWFTKPQSIIGDVTIQATNKKTTSPVMKEQQTQVG
eukprot:Gb_25127 [translate_table: standard]